MGALYHGFRLIDIEPKFIERRPAHDTVCVRTHLSRKVVKLLKRAADIELKVISIHDVGQIMIKA